MPGIIENVVDVAQIAVESLMSQKQMYGGAIYNYRQYGDVHTFDFNDISQFEKLILKIAIQHQDRSITPEKLRRLFHENGIVKANSLTGMVMGEYAMFLSRRGIVKDSSISYFSNGSSRSCRYEITAKLKPHGDFYMWKVETRLKS